MNRYNPTIIEPKWRKIWDETGVYTADLMSDKPKYIAMSMFNYPSGAGIHIGHAMNYTISDVMARYKRQQGYESYHPVGWDAFGMPAENYAIKAGVSPQDSMAKIIPSYHTQYKAMGWSNDWSKEISTHLPEYYRWTQWIFAEMFRAGLAYQDARMQWWCTKCQTVLANEQVIDGKCWRHDAADDPEVAKKEVKQWFFRITDYADELLEATDALDWSDVVKTAQKNWIGRSVGAEIEFAVAADTGAGRGKRDEESELQEEYRSYIMGQNDISEEDIIALAGKVEKVTDNGHMCVAFPASAARKFEQLITDKMQPGFWNEYVGRETVFIFKDKKGNAERIVWTPETEATLVERCSQFAGTTFTSIGDMLQSNSWYNEFLPNSKFQIPNSIPVFTTRPDTLFGVTFLVLAPEHELVDALTTEAQSQAVRGYVKQSLKKSEVERQSEGKEKTGVFTGSYAVHPLNGEKIPIWIADYVLGGYGTGAIMAVPAHDQRDHEFAKKFELPIVQVIAEEFNNRLEDCNRVTGVNVIGYDPGTKRFMTLVNKRFDKPWLVSGGLEEGEKYEEVALRELAEEAGYHDVKKLVPLGEFFYTYYFNPNKGTKRCGTGRNFLAIISEDEIVKSANEAHEDYEVRWHDKIAFSKLMDEQGDGSEHWKAAIADAISAAKYLEIGGDYEKDLFTGDGVLVNSAAFSDVPSSEARDLIIQHLEREGKGRAKTTYKLRDWSVSRQRYWGAPIPIVHCPKDGVVLVPDEQLPVVLPVLEDFAPSGDGRSALARATEWLQTTCPTCGGSAERETDTLDTYICSSWYELRYFDPHNDKAPFSSDIANKWMPIDFYNGGDHATAHLLYVRFIARFFHKIGLLDDPEPFKKFLFNGKVKASDGSAFSKSKGNGVDPLEIIGQGYGADALRTYLMFAAPLDLDSRWDPQGVPATHRFLSRVWNLTQEFLAVSPTPNSQLPSSNTEAVLRVIHPTIKKVTEDLEDQKYNTAIAAMMKCVNDLYLLKKDGFADHGTWQFVLESLVALVAPFAPHVADELWYQLGRGTSVQRDSWPVWDEQYLVSDTMTLAVQVNGKLRAEISVAADAAREEIEAAALAHEKIVALISDKKPTRVIYVPGRLVNVVL